MKKQRGQKNEGKNKCSLREIYDKIKLTRRKKERNKQTNKTTPQKLIQKIMIENFPYLPRNINLHIQEVQQTPSRKNAESFTKRYHSENVQRH